MQEPSLASLSPHFGKWETAKDIIDQLIDLMLNHRQSGHPGGSRSKVPAMVVTMLSGLMRYDLRQPGKRFADRFVLVAGHTCPLVYATLALLNEALREKHRRTGDDRYLVAGGRERTLLPEDLLNLRRRGGLPGHAEMEGKTLFFKANTGPSGHGSPVAAGQALALRMGGCREVRVFAFEGEGGMTTGATHETRNSAWGLGLGNLVYVLDWNDFGIDDQRVSDVVAGGPTEWFEAAGWRVEGTERGEDWDAITRVMLHITGERGDGERPGLVWIKNRKGRGYGVYDNKSHGAAHKPDSEAFWETKRPFAEKYGITFDGFGQGVPDSPEAFREQTWTNIGRVLEVLHRDDELLDYLADTVVAIGDSVPEQIPDFRLEREGDPLQDPRIVDARSYPPEVFARPGEKLPNRAGLGRVGAYLNSTMRAHYGRPLVVACAADLADSTNISGFAKDFSEASVNFGRYRRRDNETGALLPQEITEFANAGIMCGLTSVNFAEDPEQGWRGFIGACATYGSFSYLKYGPMRLFSQVAQDSQLRVGKVFWVAGHSGPETAEDSRTHFGIFAPGVTQLFPEGRVLNLHPWEFNEVPVLVAAALRSPVAVVALHLTRPAITIPDREALGIPSHFEAARGAYVVRAFDPSRPRAGTVIVQGTSTMNGVVGLLGELDRNGPNVKVVAAISPELFRTQSREYRRAVLSDREWFDSMAITNGARRLMHDWLPHKIAEEYTLSSDWDDRWRTGGSVDEVLDEAHISPDWIMTGIERFARDRALRLEQLAGALRTTSQD